jgi:hypothetical protein
MPCGSLCHSLEESLSTCLLLFRDEPPGAAQNARQVNESTAAWAARWVHLNWLRGGRRPSMRSAPSQRQGIHCASADAQTLGDAALRQLALQKQLAGLINHLLRKHKTSLVIGQHLKHQQRW